MKESRAHKIRGKTHHNKFPLNIVIWAEAVVTTLRSTTLGVQQEMMEVTPSWEVAGPGSSDEEKEEHTH